jgi:D-erythro-7,8-dihydroneopterin triphosphate epimerase
MAREPFDRIHIRDLHARCIVGLYDDERREKQDLIVNITLHTDLRQAGESDRIEDTVDYKKLKKSVLNMVQDSEFFLIEKVAECVAEIALTSPRVRGVDVTVDKPGALRFARSVAVEISRWKEA